MIDVTIDNRIRLPQHQLTPDLLELVMAKFTHRNPQHGKLVGMGRVYNSEPEFYYLYRQDEEELSVPRGGMQKVRDVFDELDLDYQVHDHRSSGHPPSVGSWVDGWQLGPDLFPEYKQVPWAHQAQIVEAGMRYEQVLVRSPTGSGKTDALLQLIVATGLPSLVIMWDATLILQWQQRIEAELGIPVSKQGIIRGSKFKLAPITLAMQQTLNRWDETKWGRLYHEGRSIFGGVYCDEVQRYAASTFTGQVDRLDCRYRVGVSADERRKDRKQFLIYDMFGEVRLDIPKATLVKQRIIHEVECYVVPTEFTADWYVEKREDDQVAMEDHRYLLNEMMADDARNDLAVKLVVECVRAGLPTLAFAQYVDHALLLDKRLHDQGVASGLALGGEDWEQTFVETIEGLRNGSLQAGCGTFGKLGVGHDIPTVAAGVAVTPVHNNRGFLGQVKGRICRTSEGKQHARIMVLWDQHVYGDAPLYNLKRWNEVCRVWDAWGQRWVDIAEFLKGRQNGQYQGAAGQTAPAINDDIFSSAQAAPVRHRR